MREGVFTSGFRMKIHCLANLFLMFMFSSGKGEMSNTPYGKLPLTYLLGYDFTSPLKFFLKPDST